jgi:hypothetical protein
MGIYIERRTCMKKKFQKKFQMRDRISDDYHQIQFYKILKKIVETSSIFAKWLNDARILSIHNGISQSMEIISRFRKIHCKNQKSDDTYQYKSTTQAKLTPLRYFYERTTKHNIFFYCQFSEDFLWKSCANKLKVFSHNFLRR